MHLVSIEIFITVAVLTRLVNSQCYDQEISTDSFEVKCPNNFQLVQIICHDDGWTNFLGKFNKPYVAEIIFDNCTFPETMSANQVLQLMSIRVHDAVIFKKFPSAPKRQNFQELSVPRLRLSGKYLDEIPSDLLYDLPNLEGLIISDTDLFRLPENFLANWSTSILEIHIYKNRLRKLARNDFAHLANLMILDLRSNEIDEIEPGVLDNLLNLREIDLGSNRLHTLSSDLFYQLKRLKHVHLSDNLFNSLPKDLLKNTKALVSFKMFQNRGTLKTLPNGFFKNLSDLDNVVINDGQLEILPADLFSGCTKLFLISLSDNQLRNVPSGLFDGLANLELLSIDGNRLEFLPSGIFKQLPRLRLLQINKNQLRYLSKESFQGLQSLHHLDASENNLTRIDGGIISYLKSAKFIDLSHNQLTFENLGKVEYESMPSSMDDLNKTKISIRKNDDDSNNKYKILRLKNNKISQFNDDLIKISGFFNFIDLSNNSISKINFSEHSFDMAVRNRDLENDVEDWEVKLANNPLDCDCSMLNFLRYLKERNGHKLRKIFFEYKDDSPLVCAAPASLRNREINKVRLEELSCLVETTISGDACNGTCICQEYPQIQVLSVDCSYRNLTHLPSKIHVAQNWTIELNMTGNMLQRASSSKVSYLTQVTSLDLSNNNLTEVKFDLFSSKLKNLKLHCNSISRLDSKVIGYLEGNNSLRSITLHTNKWICDCGTRHFLRFIQNKLTKYNFHDITCYESNKKLYKMSASELCEIAIAITVVAGFFIALLGITVTLVGLYYRYRQQITIWLYSKQLCLWLVTEDELDKDKEYDAFISFSHKDENFVEKEIIAKLEEGPRPYKLCLHYRDWLAGEWIPVQISRSVAESRRTIVVLTPNFLESVWGPMEFRAAHTQALKEGRARLIVILCGDIGNINDLDQELKEYLRLNTYIKWGDPLFWDKLKYALPHGKKLKKRQSQNTKTLARQQISTVHVDAAAIAIPNYPNVINDSVKLLNLTEQEITTSC